MTTLSSQLAAMFGDEWRVIPAFGRNYAASNMGKIATLYFRNGTVKRSLKMRIKKTHVDINGYESTVLYHNKKPRTCFVHGLILLAFVGKKPNGYQCDHKNCIKTDNRIENLQYVTAKENRDFRVSRRRMDFHGRHPNCKLKSEDVVEIKRLLRAKAQQKDIAKRFNISIHTISSIKCEKTWRYIE